MSIFVPRPLSQLQVCLGELGEEIVGKDEGASNLRST